MQFFLTVPHDTAEEPTMASINRPNWRPRWPPRTSSTPTCTRPERFSSPVACTRRRRRRPSTPRTAPVVVDGPFVKAPEYVGGFWVIEAADRDAAVRWAIQASKALGGRIEVRALQEVPDAD